ncbi:MAG: Flp pilus assembly complex ATPase component TadA [Firmicutes bacterium]|nr:Flp pilus assembly complex ATPase component TadA [Bacillota bacterium]
MKKYRAGGLQVALGKKRLGDLLVATGYITPEALREVISEQSRTGERLGRILVNKGYITEQSLIEALEFQLGIPHVVLAKRKIPPEVLAAVPERIAKQYKVFPVERKGNRLVLGMLDPTDVMVLDNLRLLLNMEIQPVIVTEEDLERALSKYYGIQETVAEVFRDLDIEFEEEKREEEPAAEALVEDAPIVRLVNLIISQAVKERASDIHLEPSEEELVVRYRVDGMLRRVMTSPKNTQAAIISRVKIISGMNIAEKRLPQDGRIQLRVEGIPVDIRVSSIPTVHGEKVVMRLLYKTGVLMKMERLGFLPEMLEKFRSIYRQPHGIILVTGPTGSGKSTTLCAVLNELNSPEVNIMTVEDPVEYQIPGVNQVQVNQKAGLTFTTALRSFLRQDPDIIMVGEIRDTETARIATQAALTGHLVLSTLHTNDAPSSITRLIDMEIEPFLVASTVIGVIAQRLVRGVCNGCKEQYRLTPMDPFYRSVRENLPDHPDEELIFYRGKGCHQCNGTGYVRRLAIHEVLLLDQQLRALISRDVPAGAIKEEAVKAGMKTLFQDGLLKALQGKTTLEEVVRASYSI